MPPNKTPNPEFIDIEIENDGEYRELMERTLALSEGEEF